MEISNRFMYRLGFRLTRAGGESSKRGFTRRLENGVGLSPFAKVHGRLCDAGRMVEFVIKLGSKFTID